MNDEEMMLREAFKYHTKKHGIKYAARTNVSWAVQVGVLIKPKTCSECCREVDLEGHHKDYSKPLEVEWLCKLCHRLRHPWKFRPAKRIRNGRGNGKLFKNVQDKFAKQKRVIGKRLANDWQVSESMREREEWDRLEKGSHNISLPMST